MPETENNEHSGISGTRPPQASGFKRRWLVNAGLLGLIAALVWMVAQRSGQQQDHPSQPLAAQSATTVSHVRIERPGQPAIAIEKSGNEWKLTAPIPARANRLNVETLLRVLSAPVETRFPAVTAELAQYGLATPMARVWLDNEEIDFGTMHPLKNQVYVLHNSEVALIPGYHFSAATYPYNNFIDSRLFEEDRKLASLKLPGFMLSLNGGVWRRQPVDKKLTSDRINDFASEWQNASALSVDKYSGKESVGSINVSFIRDGKSEKLTLAILAYKPDFILYRPDENLEYHFTEETGRRLLNLSVQ